MRTLSAYWFAAEGTTAAWTQALVIQHSLDDVDAMFEAGDWAMCVDCAFESVLGACLVLAVADGYTGPPSEPDSLLRALRDGGRVVELLDSLPLAPGATREDAERARTTANDAAALVADVIPLQIVGFRRPEGFYPGVRVAKDLEKLRGRMGMPGFSWAHWTT